MYQTRRSSCGTVLTLPAPILQKLLQSRLDLVPHIKCGHADEFVVDRAVKNAASLTRQRFMVPRLEETLKADFETYIPIHQLHALTNRIAKASRGMAQKVLEDTVRRSLDLLSPVGTPEAVKNMAASLCITHGLKESTM
jgi:hypothetical protein